MEISGGAFILIFGAYGLLCVVVGYIMRGIDNKEDSKGKNDRRPGL
jgi:hypothetical protein